jgi:hypothetical protein
VRCQLPVSFVLASSCLISDNTKSTEKIPHLLESVLTLLIVAFHK